MKFTRKRDDLACEIWTMIETRFCIVQYNNVMNWCWDVLSFWKIMRLLLCLPTNNYTRLLVSQYNIRTPLAYLNRVSYKIKIIVMNSDYNRTATTMSQLKRPLIRPNWTSNNLKSISIYLRPHKKAMIFIKRAHKTVFWRWFVARFWLQLSKHSNSLTQKTIRNQIRKAIALYNVHRMKGK